MADETTGTPQSGTTNQTTGTAQNDGQVQDFQINLEDAPKIEVSGEIKENIGSSENKESGLDFDLNLNLSDAPRNDDRLKFEDQKNEETHAPIPEPAVVVPMNVQSVLEPLPGETPTETAVTEAIQTIEAVVEQTENKPSIEQIFEPAKSEDAATQASSEAQVHIEPIVEPIKAEPATIQTPIEEAPETSIPEPVIEQITTPENVSTEIEKVQMESPEIVGEDVPKSSSLENDMKIINELEGNTSAGGLAPEAIIQPQETPKELPKTFDLDAMLGNPTSPTITEKTPIISTATAIPEFTIPTTTTQVPIQAIPQITIPHKKNVGVKVFLFVIMFVGLGFTTFFILKTMYPVEFANILDGQTQMHASEITTGSEITGAETTGTEIVGTEMTGLDQLSGITDIGTGTHDSATGDNTFSELGDLGDTTTTPPEESDISRLTSYVTQGNDFLAQGKTLNDNKVIKYSLYITKKATTFLEDIANGKEINNLNGYFAQFDEYIAELKILVGQTSDTSGTTLDASTPSPTNDSQSMTPEITTTTPPETGIVSQ